MSGYALFMEANWDQIAKRISWYKPWAKTSDCHFTKPISIKWFIDAELNASYNCIDRHLPQRAKQVAFIWEPDSPDEESLKISYQDLHDSVCRMANILKAHGVQKGDRVTIYMPMIPEAAYAMLACARIGAVHSVIFAGFSAESIANRILDCESNFVITADEGFRGGKKVPLKNTMDEAIEKLGNKNTIRSVLVVKRTGGITTWNKDTDHWYHDELCKVDAICEPERMNSEDPLFMLYTSGSTGKPKGVLHTTGGYLVYASYTHELVFDYKPGDVYWCTADIGWITGHSYSVYGPLANGATSILFEGIPSYPNFSRFWDVIDKYKVNIFYTAPTAIRALMKEGDEPVTRTSRKSLRVLGTVGEPINPDVWNWYHRVVGDSRCPVVDTWWQTETGGILISATAKSDVLKPGSASEPLPGIFPEVLSSDGKVLEGECEGVLVLKSSWPGQMRTVYNDHARFEETYFSAYPGYYFTGDGCRRDEDGFYWITGRVDDVINVSGHRLGTAEVESALVAHHHVAEAAVVGFPHDIKGQGIYAYVTLKSGFEGTDALKKELIAHVRKMIGPIATPDAIQWAPGLPKTRSGKIMRRILRKVAEGDFQNLGDISTLADPGVVKDLVQNRNQN
ncbi:MAG: acetate--CoA ligase [Bdellovibrionales bacterium RIFCSPHIGHO2_01_FULL_40_29]|nr:MAG: acetate--CoA ligase [Bdellovibrionales bacterium RIFCSPHIGHO2_01_FULL_40_29]OFZ32377.1 MAG: acetate--CoA ligase [Bdellovibrionales bacterium RIFCSPHIGHO2_02_FULL_40_15]